VRTGIALAIAMAALAGLLIAEGLLPAAWLPLEEAAVAEQARGEPLAPGTASAGVYPVLVGVVADRVDGETLLGAARLLNALLWVGVAAATFVLARSRASVRVSAIAAAGAALLPAAVYASALAPEALATCLAAWAFALFAQPGASARVSPLAAALACAVIAATLRPWLAAVPLGLVLAYALPRLHWRALAPWPLPLAVALLAGVAVWGLTGISNELERASVEPFAFLRAAVACAAVGAIGMAVVPWIVAWAQAGRARTDPLVAVLVTTGPALAVAGGVEAFLHDGPAVDERAVVVLAPVVMALAAGAWESTSISTRAFLVAGVATAATMTMLPTPVEDPSLTGAPGLALVWSASKGLAAAGTVFALLTLGLTLAIVGALRRPYVWALVGAALIVAHATAWREAERSAHAIATALPESGWIDEHVDASRAVALLDGRGDLTPPLLAQLALVNRALGESARVDPASADESSGALPVAISSPLVLARGLEVAGSPVAEGTLGTLVRVMSPLRRAFGIDGVDSDGWAGAQARYRRFTDSAPGTMRVTVSRRAWGGADVPGTVVVRLTADSGASAETRWTIHSKQHRVFDFTVPRGPFELEVTVDPTFSPADFGSPDRRQLGAQVSFEYLPGS
jgi:hypothetical protein